MNRESITCTRDEWKTEHILTFSGVSDQDLALFRRLTDAVAASLPDVKITDVTVEAYVFSTNKTLDHLSITYDFAPSQFEPSCTLYVDFTQKNSAKPGIDFFDTRFAEADDFSVLLRAERFMPDLSAGTPHPA